MKSLLLLLWLFEIVSGSFWYSIMGSSATTPQYNAYAGGAGCPSSGCIPPTIVPKTSGFWPNADLLTGLQIEQNQQNTNQNQNQNQNQNPNINSPQQDAPNNGQNQPLFPGISSSTPQPVIYIARAGSDQYRYSESSSTQSPIGIGNGLGIGNNWNNGGIGFQNQMNQFSGNQNSNQNWNQNGNQNPFQPNQNQNQNSNFGNAGFFNNQNQNSQNSQNQQQGSQNSLGSSGFINNQNQNPSSGSSSGFFNNQNNNQNTQQGNTGSQGSQNPFASGNSQASGFIQGGQQNNNPFGNQNQGSSNLPFGPNMMPNSNTQMGPQPFQPNQVGSIRQSPQFPEKDWNFQPGSQSVHFVGGNGAGNGGLTSGGSNNVPMTEEAQQIAVQIQAIRENLSITRDESNYLISQLKASLPQEIQSQLQMF
ncbi:hypothetical protein L5515_004644 [Caenorhabditis briggsae]|uniref:Uncharacterized protein n=2 Tax=Caenorhabditis briggsae TaxID=6238 RepID=A0AAE9EMG2_CAEBR|nr:hypothetical protein L5515_004644 [Caenorhabditis briggsae]